MQNHVVKRIDDMESFFHGAFKRAGAELGVRSFGMQVVDLPGDSADYPEHDHTHDGQEEVYVVLRGSANFVIDGTPVGMDADRIVRIADAAKRTVMPGPDGVRLLVIGGVPDKLYERPRDFELGAPDPTAASTEVQR